MDTTHTYLVILAGGSGTRLWPLSRRNFPKQFLKLGSDRSLVQETADRLLPLSDWSRVLIVCGEDHGSLMKKEFPRLREDQFLLEPCGRNTAPAIALASKVLLKKDPQSVMVILPADHKILAEDHKVFQEVVKTAVEFSQEKGGLLTLGVRPAYPATGYGYVRRGALVKDGGSPIHRVEKFQEKPDLQTAQTYLKDGTYFWNSGMFVWRAADYWEAYQKYLPQDAKAFDSIPSDLSEKEGAAALKKIYPHLTSISVDYAVLEKSDSVYTIAAPFRWDDVGSLNSLYPYFPRDGAGNARGGEMVTLDSKGNLILSEGGVVACLGVNNLVVIRQGDAVLVLPRERSEEVKALLEEMKRNGLEKFL